MQQPAGRFSTATITLQGVELEIRERGSGPPLLYLHDEFTEPSDEPFLDALAGSFRVLAPSHPGFGHSSLPEHFDTVDDLAFFYLDLLDAFDLQDVTLAGVSFGGWVAAQLAVCCSARLGRLALIDPIGIKAGSRETREIADVFSLPPTQVSDLLYHAPPPAPDYRAMSDADLAAIARTRAAFALFAWEPFAHDPKLRARLHRIQVPTLILWGESDRITTYEYAEAYRDAIPGARLETVGEAGHVPHREQPGEIAERLIAFGGRR